MKCTCDPKKEKFVEAYEPPVFSHLTNHNKYNAGHLLTEDGRMNLEKSVFYTTEKILHWLYYEDWKEKVENHFGIVDGIIKPLSVDNEPIAMTMWCLESQFEKYEVVSSDLNIHVRLALKLDKRYGRRDIKEPVEWIDFGGSYTIDDEIFDYADGVVVFHINVIYNTKNCTVDIKDYRVRHLPFPFAENEMAYPMTYVGDFYEGRKDRVYYLPIQKAFTRTKPVQIAIGSRWVGFFDEERAMFGKSASKFKDVNFILPKVWQRTYPMIDYEGIGAHESYRSFILRTLRRALGYKLAHDLNMSYLNTYGSELIHVDFSSISIDERADEGYFKRVYAELKDEDDGDYILEDEYL